MRSWFDIRMPVSSFNFSAPASLTKANYGSSQQLSLREVIFPIGDQNNYAVKLVYGKKGLLGIKAGPSLTAADIEALSRTGDSELSDQG